MNERSPRGAPSSGEQVTSREDGPPPQLEARSGEGTHQELKWLLAERTAQLQAETEQRCRHQRAWRTLSGCNQAVVRATEERALFQEVCRILVEVGGYRMCWVGLAESDADGSVQPVAMAGHEEGYLAGNPVSWSAESKRGRGPVGTAIRSGAAVVVRSTLDAAEFEPWREAAQARGYGSMVALPMRSEGRTFGALAIYAPDARSLDSEELALLNDLVSDVAFGASALRARAERSRMTAQLMQADRLVAMGTLAAGVGHEINNPLSYVLTGVEALADLVAQGEVGPSQAAEARGVLREVRQGLDRIRQAVRDLKLFSRGDEEARRPVELRGVLEGTLHMASNDIRHRARLVRQYGPAPRVLASEARLGQIFLNLVVNASQAIRDGAADENLIRVSTRTDARGWAVTEIEDTGAGISCEDQARIFEPFFTTKPLGEGTGLGLAICRNLVEAMGGEIAVESAPGRGSVFRVSLPPAPATAVEPVPRAASGITAGARRGRLLVVDDDPLVARSIRRVLERDHEVVMETSSREALGRFQAGERFDLVLCDVMMPQMSGPEFHAALGRLVPEQAKRVVFVTGGAFTATTLSYLEEVGARTVEKPFEAENLRALARDFC